LIDYVSRFLIPKDPKNSRKSFKITKKGNFDGHKNFPKENGEMGCLHIRL
jgi:hypothetical protein